MMNKLEVHDSNPAGGKITTYRKLAESALKKLENFLPIDDKPWTAGVPLPGGAFPVDGVLVLIKELKETYSFLDTFWASRLVKAYGLEAFDVLGNAMTQNDLGIYFGASLTEREVNWLIQKEYARSADDIIWRRSKLGLRLTSIEISTLNKWMENI